MQHDAQTMRHNINKQHSIKRAGKWVRLDLLIPVLEIHVDATPSKIGLKDRHTLPKHRVRRRIHLQTPQSVIREVQAPVGRVSPRHIAR
jgi:hypothetical protein